MLKQEYAVILLLLKQIIESKKKSERKELAKEIRKRLKMIDSRLTSAEKKIDNIADAAVAASKQITAKKSQNENMKDFSTFDAVMDMYRDIALVKLYGGNNDTP